MDNSAAARWQEWASYTLGLWLAMSPWICGYEEQQAATANAVFLGVALALVSHFEAVLGYTSAQWLNLGAGLWLVAAPFLLDFGPSGVPSTNCVVVGTVVVVFAASALSLDKEVEKWRHKA